MRAATAEMQARTAPREAEKTKARPAMAEKEPAAPPPPPPRSEAPRMENHRITSIFPAMETVEFAALKADIAEHGLREPIWTYQGAIIDGRHRERACGELGIKPAVREWDGNGSLVAFVASLNWHRRHLTAGQRAMVALGIKRELADEARKRQAHGQTAPGRTLQEIFPEAAPQGQARDEAARLAHVNPHYVTDAQKLVETSPALAEQVKAGKISIPKAKEQSRAQHAGAGNTPQADDADASIGRFDLTGALVGLERLAERIAGHDIDTLCDRLEVLLKRFRKRCSRPDSVIETNGQLVE
jgi:ParB-like chromosome segregation protein Spo0J